MYTPASDEEALEIYRKLSLIRQVEEAIKVYSEGIEHWPDDVELLIARGASLLQEGEILALSDFKRAVALDPENAEARVGLGNVCAKLGSASKAEQHATRALLYQGGNYHVLHNVACTYAKLSQSNPDREEEYQDRAMDLLQLAVELWRRGETKSHNALEEIAREPWFPESMQNRDDFRQLIGQPAGQVRPDQPDDPAVPQP